MRSYFMSFLVVVTFLSACQSGKADKDLEFELRRSFKNYVNALNNRAEAELRIVFNVPGLQEYKKHVDELYLKYLEDVASGSVTFDKQGIVLTRFLRLGHYNYGILQYGKNEGGDRANMKISVHFSYDANIKQSDFEKGTKLYIPGRPFGKVETLVVGGENKVPREQLKYIEVDIQFRRTNFEGIWQVMDMKIVPDSPEFETSFKGDF